MKYKDNAYSEIIKNFATFFSSTATAIFSFISVAWIIALSIPGNQITFSGYEIQVNAPLVFAAIGLAFAFFAAIILNPIIIVFAGRGKLKMMTISEAASLVLILIFLSSSLFAILIYLFLRNQITKPGEYTKQAEATFKSSIDQLLERKLYVPQKLQSDGVMPSSSTILGVIKLEAYARKLQPKFLIGINRGGWLLSTYLAHRLEIKRSRILRYDSEKDAILEANTPFTTEGDKILLVDDISRTGISILKGRQKIQESFPLCDLSTAILVVCQNNNNDEYIDFNAYYTNTKDIQLPWSPEDRKQEARDRLAKEGTKSLLVGSNKDSLTEDSDILRLALDEQEQEGIDIARNDIDTFLSFIQEMPSSEINVNNMSDRVA